MDFYIKNKIIQLDKQSLQKEIVGDNTGYVANFIFDDEWNGKVKIARFVNNGIYKDVVLNDNDSCNIPIEVMKSGIVEVGVYAGNLQTTTATCVMITPSILEKYGIPADLTPSVYVQILELVETVKEEAVTDAEVKAVVDRYLEENPNGYATEDFVTSKDYITLADLPIYEGVVE